MSLHFLPARPEDVPELNRLVNSAYRGDESRKGWTTEADLLDGSRIDEAALLDILNAPGTTILLCKEHSRLLGCVELREAGHRLYLGMLSVDPAEQGRGIGKNLMQAGENYAREKGLTHVYMTVISDRSELISWYERHGYLFTGERKPFIMPDERWGIPKKNLEFVVLEKIL